MAIQSLKLNCFFFPQLRTTSAVVVSVTCRFSVMENMSFSFVGVYLWVVYMSHLWKKVILLNTKAKCLENDIRSDQISCSVMSNSLQPHESQHTRPPCPSPLPVFTQTHVHWVSDAIQPSHLLWSPSAPAFILSQHQGLFQWISSLHQLVKVLEFQFQHQSFQWIFRTDFL